jgi:hypothetical protein
MKLATSLLRHSLCKIAFYVFQDGSLLSASQTVSLPTQRGNLRSEAELWATVRKESIFLIHKLHQSRVRTLRLRTRVCHSNTFRVPTPTSIHMRMTTKWSISRDRRGLLNVEPILSEDSWFVIPTSSEDGLSRVSILQGTHDLSDCRQ